MRFIAVIPARYAATRFPAKLMQMLGDKPVIVHTYNNTKATGLFDEVFVVTDSTIIFDEIVKQGGKAIMSKKEHDSGTDRIAEAVENLDVDVIVNVQGDEPFVQKEPLQKLCALFNEKEVQIASLMHIITDEEMITDPNCVKVVVKKNMDALYFSRSVIPYKREQLTNTDYYKHIGIYAYKKEALLTFTGLPVSTLEKTEKLEQLRLLENGFNIRLSITTPWGVSIDTPKDLEKAKEILK